MPKPMALVQTDDRNINQLQINIKQSIQPFITNPVCNGVLLKSVSLLTGSNSVNHTLGTKLQGWIVVRARSSAIIYDTQDTNQTPNTTLNLTASAPVIVDLYVF